METFFHCSNHFLNLSILMPFSASAVFCFTSSTSARHFLLRTFLIRETKKVSQGPMGWIASTGHGAHAVFGQKLLNIQCSVGRHTLIHHPSWNGQVCWVFKKHSLKPNATSHDDASWYTDTDGFLEHSPSGGSLYYKGPALQEIILRVWVDPPHTISLLLFDL